MKKWSVGLVAAGLCAASAWAASYTLVTSMEGFGAGNYVITGEKAEGEEHAMLNQVASGNYILQKTDAEPIEDGVLSDSDESIVWTVDGDATSGWTIYNEIAGGYVNYPGGKNNAATEATVTDDSTWAISFAEDGSATVENAGTPERVLQYNASASRFACYLSTMKPLKFYKEGSPALSVAIEPSEDFADTTGHELVQGTTGTLTAVVKNGEGPFTYVWSCGPYSGDIEAFDIPASGFETGSYTAMVTVTDSSEPPQTASAVFEFTVVSPPGSYVATVADGIENGSVALWLDGEELENPAEVLQGTQVTVAATPASPSFKLETLSVTGESSGGQFLEDGAGTFVMPAENVFVTATFVERSQTAFTLVNSMDDFEDGADYLIVAHKDGDYTSALKNEYQSESNGRIAVEEVEIDDDTVETEDDSIVWKIAAGSNEGQYTLYNAAAAKFVSAPASSNLNEAVLVDVGTTDAAQWTIDIADEDPRVTIGSIYDGKSLQRNSNSGNTYFANYKGGTKPYLFKKVGTGVFSVTLDPAEDFDVIQDEEASIAATPKNAVGEVTYAWTVDGVAAETDGPVLALSTGALGEHVVVCVATDGGAEGVTAQATVTYTVVAAPAQYTVTIADGIENGSVALNLDGYPIATPIELLEGTEVTVEATPDAGFALESITVNGTPLIEGNTFVVAGDSEVSATFAESTLDTYVLVESEGEFEAGAEYLVVASKEGTFTSALKNEASGTRIAAAEVSIEEDGTIKTDDATIVWKIQAGAGEGKFVLFNEAASVYAAATKNDNVAQLLENGTDALAQWTLDFTALPAVKIVSVSYSSRCLQRNSQADNAYFATYTGTQTTPSLYKKAGPAVFGITLDPAGDFDVIQDEEASVVATAKNAVGDVTYAWTVDGVAAETDGPVLALSTGELGEHVVVCVATDGGAEGVTAEASVTYTVVAAPALYEVTVADGIENGTIALNLNGTPIETPINLLEGTEVTVEATPADGYELEAITVNGTSIEGTTFVVAGDSEVSATFAAVVDYATLPFLAEGTPFAGPWQNAKVAGMTSEGLGTDYNTEADGRGARFDNTGDWLQIKFEGTPGELSYALKGQGTSAESVSTFDVWESATGGEETWTSVANHKSGENLINGVKTNFTAELKADSRFVKFAYTEKVQGNVALFDVYIANGGFSVTVDKTGFELEQGTPDTVTAEAKNGIEPYTYVWTSETEALNGEGAELAIPDTLEAGEYAVTVTAMDSSDEPQTATADVTFSVVEPAAKYPVSIDVGILNGNIEADVLEAAEGDTVTLTATPDPGYKLGTITVTYGEETLEFTTSPATFEMPAAEVFVGASFVERGDEFVKITSVEDLEEGDYVITGTAPDGEYAMLAELVTSGTPHIKQGDNPVEIEADTISGPADSIVWTLAKTADGWTIHNDAVGFVGYLASGNSAGAEEEATAKSTWTISESGGPFLVQNVGNTSRRLLYNVGSTRFACYTSDPSSSFTPLTFYKKAGPAVFAVSVDDTGFKLTQGEAATVTAAARNGAEPYSYVWTSETEALNGVEGAELAIPGTLEPGEYSATVTATDSSAEPQTATADVAFTVVAPLPVYTVAVADGIENGTVTVDKTEAEAGETVTVTATPDENYKLEAILVNGTPIEGNTFAIEGDSVISATFAEIVKYPVTVDGVIEHGTIAADKTEAEAGETVTLSCEPEEGWKLETYLLGGEPIEGNTFVMPEGEAVVSAVFTEIVLVTYVPVESAADLVAGGEYLVVAHKDDGFTSALKNENSGTRIGVDEVTIAADGSIETDNDAIVWEIRAGAEEGEYVLYNASAGVYAAALSDGNTAQVLADGTDPLSQWTIDLAEAPAVKIASAAYPSRWLQRNSTPNNKFFAAYTGSQTTPALYKKAGFSVGFDKEDGFTVEAGTADSITATALRGTEPYSYAWTGDLEGDGATLAIPDNLAEGGYSVKVTATDSSEPPQTAEKEISFTVVPQTVRYAVTVAEGIVGGEVTVDKALAEAGETVTVTATPASGYVLVAITLDGEPIEGNTFEMPAQDVVVSATFDEVVDYAVLPFVAQETPYSGPWQLAEVVGLTSSGLGSDYRDGSAKFDDTGDWMQIKFQGTPGSLSYGIKGNSLTETNVSTFAVLESTDGETWTTVAAYASAVPEEGGESVILLGNAKLDEKYTLSEDSRFVKFFYETKGAGNVGIYDVYISEAGAAEPAVTVTGDTTLTLGGTFALELALENYTGEYTWAWEPATVGYVDADTATFWWTPTAVGVTEVTFSAVAGTRTIASETVTLTVASEPALVFDGDDEGTAGTPVSFTVVAEYVADPAVTFLGFLDVPEGSALTDGDVVLDFPNVTFTPDVAGDYGLVFSAGTEGVDYVEDLWIVTVAEPEVVFDGDDSGTTGRAVKFSVAAAIPGGSVDFENFLCNFPEGSSLTEDDVTIDTETGEVSFTPDVPGEYEFAFALVGGQDCYIWMVTVEGEEPPAELPEITDMLIDTDEGTILLVFKGAAASVYGTSDLKAADSWAPVEDAVIEGDTATVPMGTPFLRVQ